MSTSVPVTTGAPTEPPAKRVRQQAREVAVLMVFSAATSLALATALMLLASLGHQG
jgi:hypothetical protein